MIAGGVESMSRAPFVMGKADTAFSRTRRNLRHHHRLALRQSRDESANTASIPCPRPPKTSPKNFTSAAPIRTPSPIAPSSAGPARSRRIFHTRNRPRPHPAKKRRPQKVRYRRASPSRHHSRALAKLKPIVKPNGTVTAGNASGINDGSCALLLASEAAAKKYNLTPCARMLATSAVGVAPRIMGFAPAPATKKMLQKTNLQLSQINVIELNEAFAAQALAVTRDLGLPDDAAHVNPTVAPSPSAIH